LNMKGRGLVVGTSVGRKYSVARGKKLYVKAGGTRHGREKRRRKR